MHKYLNKATGLGLLLLAGCQMGGGRVFTNPSNSYPFYRSSPSFSQGATLSQKVQEALSLSDDPYIAQVHVETNQNLVILSGYVKKIRQSDLAAQVAGQVAGPQNVQNNLIVRQ